MGAAATSSSPRALCTVRLYHTAQHRIKQELSLHTAYVLLEGMSQGLVSFLLLACKGEGSSADAAAFSQTIIFRRALGEHE